MSQGSGVLWFVLTFACGLGTAVLVWLVIPAAPHELRLVAGGVAVVLVIRLEKRWRGREREHRAAPGSKV
jgi:hypothetical protein